MRAYDRNHTRLGGLLDEPRPGAPRKIGDGEVDRVVTLTLESTPRDATHWSTRAMATRRDLRLTRLALGELLHFPLGHALDARQDALDRPL